MWYMVPQNAAKELHNVMVMLAQMNLVFSDSVWAPIPGLTCLDLHVAIVILRAALHKESRPIWGFDMRKSLYKIGLIR